MLAEQLPCFLLTEANMQHPQKTPAGFCFLFLVRVGRGGGGLSGVDLKLFVL